MRQARLRHAQVRTAYEVLSDPLLRSLYDTKLSSRSGGPGTGGREASGASDAPAAANGARKQSVLRNDAGDCLKRWSLWCQDRCRLTRTAPPMARRWLSEPPMKYMAVRSVGSA